MRTGIVMVAALAVAAVVGLVGQRHTDTPPPQPVTNARTGAMGDAFDFDESAPSGENATLRGRVSEVINVAEYTYLRLASAQGEVWAAVSKAPIAVNSDVAVDNPTRMTNFESATLKRTFDVIYFGNLATPGAPNGTALPPGHPSIDGASSPPHVHGGTAASGEAPELAEIKVSRARGGNAHTVGELFADAKKLDGRLVRIRGQVTKVTPGVLGKTYLRLRDGSGGRPEERELVVTIGAEPRVGDVATLEGTLRTQVDVGIGYKYAVLLMDAQAVTEP